MPKQDVQSLFNSIAHRYDFLNHLLSGGIDLYWRRRAVEHLREVSPRRILDVATGTADFALATLRVHPDKVIGVDIADEMLKEGRRKIARQGHDSVIILEKGEAENLRYETASFDAAIVAFGARNFENLEKGLSEMHRVLRSGGKIVVLEFSQPKRFPFRQVYLFYFTALLPHIGRMISQSREAYTYLPDTVMRFPDGEEFLSILHKVGFSHTLQERLTFGIATVYTGMKD